MYLRRGWVARGESLTSYQAVAFSTEGSIYVRLQRSGFLDKVNRSEESLDHAVWASSGVGVCSDKVPGESYVKRLDVYDCQTDI